MVKLPKKSKEKRKSNEAENEAETSKKKSKTRMASYLFFPKLMFRVMGSVVTNIRMSFILVL